MKFSNIVLSLVAIAVFVASPASAGNGDLRLSWDFCDPLVKNKDYTGMDNYVLVLSVSNADVGNKGYRTKVLFGPNNAEAWQFYPGGCQDGQLSVSPHSASSDCPPYGGSGSFNFLAEYGDNGDGSATLNVVKTYGAFFPVPANRYTMWQAVFDHWFSTAGDGDPAQFCRFAEDPMCVKMPPVSAEILLLDDSGDVYELENDWVTWNDPTNQIGCPLVQTLSHSWGRVKGLYR